MYTCSYSSNPIYLPFDASPSEHVNIFYFTLNYRDFANYRFRKLQISQTADFANYRFRKLQISQITDFANCRFRKLQISFRFVSFRFVNYSKPLRRNIWQSLPNFISIFPSHRARSLLFRKLHVSYL